jgi:hypothetical protein
VPNADPRVHHSDRQLCSGHPSTCDQI